MCAEEAETESSTVPTPRAKSPRNLDLVLSVNREAVKGFMEDLRQLVRQTIREELAAQQAKPRVEPKVERQMESQVPASSVPRRGTELSPEEPLKAKVLRTALLLGKLPETAGLLIDMDTVAGLMSVSRRTLERLVSEKAIPEPIRISGRLVRWRLAELLEWIEAGCPHTKHWSYIPTQGRQTRPRR